VATVIGADIVADIIAFRVEDHEHPILMRGVVAGIVIIIAVARIVVVIIVIIVRAFVSVIFIAVPTAVSAFFSGGRSGYQGRGEQGCEK
jgi:hypothetical protein